MAMNVATISRAQLFRLSLRANRSNLASLVSARVADIALSHCALLLDHLSGAAEERDLKRGSIPTRPAASLTSIWILTVCSGDMRGKAIGCVPESSEIEMFPSSVASPRISM
jgi:hypothetical protein